MSGLAFVGLALDCFTEIARAALLPVFGSVSLRDDGPARGRSAVASGAALAAVPHEDESAVSEVHKVSKLTIVPPLDE